MGMVYVKIYTPFLWSIYKHYVFIFTFGRSFYVLVYVFQIFIYNNWSFIVMKLMSYKTSLLLWFQSSLMYAP